MDETKQNPGDSSSKGDTSKGGAGSTSTAPETFTKEMVDKAVNDALSKAGRDAKSMSELETRLNTGMAELTAKQIAWQKKQDEAEEEGVMDNPEALAALREKRRQKVEEEAKNTELAERETKLAERETEIADIIEQHKILTRTLLAAEVAVEKGVSIDAILKLAKEDTREAYEAVAEVLPKTTQTLLPDSSRTIGGGTMPESATGKIKAGWAELHK